MPTVGPPPEEQSSPEVVTNAERSSHPKNFRFFGASKSLRDCETPGVRCVTDWHRVSEAEFPKKRRPELVDRARMRVRLLAAWGRRANREASDRKERRVGAWPTVRDFCGRRSTKTNVTRA
ncbi:hypothetical protein [Haladaptatus pallidirubidus]|uniref:hypothetical protein n=1 Tax=Haladaptatus pallidirubidus TaxID=1008152 RepID=UPI001D0FF53A|nr:hypothetical protein [Haladaptatus pallidirubidus]